MTLLLSTLGIYGVMSFGISLRVREIGVRIALGADPRHVRGMLMREGATLVAIGIAFGLAGAFALSRVLESLLVGVGVLDVATFVAAPCLLAAVAMTACWLPAREATRIAPAIAFRVE